MDDNITGKETFDWIQAHDGTDFRATCLNFQAKLARIAQKATFFHSNFSTMFSGEFDQDELHELRQLRGVKYIESWYVYARSWFVVYP